MKYTIVSFSFKKVIYCATFSILFIIIISNGISHVMDKKVIKNFFVEKIKSGAKLEKKEKLNIAKNNLLLYPKKEEKKEKVNVYDKKESITKEDENIITVMRSLSKDEIEYNEKNFDTYQKITLHGVNIFNYSYNRTIDYYDLLKKEILFRKGKDKVLLYNTHTSESYANSENYKFGYTGTYRTTDARYNMLNIAQKIKDNLISKNIETIHDTTPHDYGSYNNSYKLSRKTLDSRIKNNPNITVSFDVHRDAAGDLSKGYSVKIGDKDAAQMSLVVGIGTEKSPNPYALDNLALAIQIVEVANKKYPGLFRRIIVRNSKYNQDLKKYSLLMEVGFTGNTIEEAEYSSQLFANVLNLFYK